MVLFQLLIATIAMTTDLEFKQENWLSDRFSQAGSLS